MSRIALVVGGTGMLAELCHEIAGQYLHIGVIGRTKSKMQNVLDIPNVVPIYVDYNDLPALERKLTSFVEAYGKPSLTVAWVHSTAPAAVPAIARFCEGKLYEVTGQSGHSKGHISHEHEAAAAKLGLEYHRVVLGGMGSRWLTNHEISAGVLAALSCDDPEYLVGQL